MLMTYLRWYSDLKHLTSFTSLQLTQPESPADKKHIRLVNCKASFEHFDPLCSPVPSRQYTPQVLVWFPSGILFLIQAGG